MNDADVLSRITTNPRVLGGKPVIRGTRLSVEHVLNVLAHGATVQEILDDHPGVTEADILACDVYACASSDVDQP
jgi:uncharacterized protein (DUF433 family)